MPAASPIPDVVMTPVVSSSNVTGFGYDAASSTLVVSFKTGTYDYQGVPAAVYRGFQEAESKGSYFIKSVKPYYSGVKRQPAKVEPETPADTSREDATVAPTAVPETGRVPWPFPVSTPHHPV